MFVYIRGDEPEALAAIEQCAQENGGRVVGAPTVQRNWMGISGGKATVIQISDVDDPKGWWSDWGDVHALLMIPDEKVEAFLEKHRA